MNYDVLQYGIKPVNGEPMKSIKMTLKGRHHGTVEYDRRTDQWRFKGVHGWSDYWGKTSGDVVDQMAARGWRVATD